jgi:hypothetical protein
MARDAELLHRCQLGHRSLSAACLNGILLGRDGRLRRSNQHKTKVKSEKAKGKKAKGKKAKGKKRNARRKIQTPQWLNHLAFHFLPFTFYLLPSTFSFT